MDTRYIYASTRAKTLETQLMTENQLERLITAKSLEEVFTALQDTFLARYLQDHDDAKLSQALDETVIDAKKVLASIAPEPELMDVLWIKYDYYNIKTVIKGRLAGLSDDEIIDHCFKVGIYEPEKILKLYDEDKLGTLNPDFATAVKVASDRKEVSTIDITMNAFYFESIKQIASKSKNAFIKDFVQLLIDIFNIKSQLRIVTERTNGAQRSIFVEGGNFERRDFETEEDVLKSFGLVLQDPKVSDEAVNDFRERRDFSLIEKRLEEKVISYLKEKSIELYSPAPLFAYFTAQKNNAQIVRTVMVGKRSNLPEHEIRFMLRKLYA